MTAALAATLPVPTGDEQHMVITVAIPTHNRPQLLREALASVAAQTYPHWEVVVVDDGSSPPVAESMLLEILGKRVTLVRHDLALGIAAAKNAGVTAARGEIVLHLDDDDLLSPTALADIAAAYARHPELECLFINIEPFGALASGTAENQDLALSKLMERAQGEAIDGVVFFRGDLFRALLKSVPMAMQRPAARKGLWSKVGLLRKESYMPEPEWAMKCAVSAKSALLLQRACLFRVDGQNYVSLPAQKEKHLLAAIDIRNTLLIWIAQNAALAARAREVKQSLADVYFDQAYHYGRSGNAGAAWRPLLYSFLTQPRWRIARLLVSLLIPRARRAGMD